MPQFYETFFKYLHRMILPGSALLTVGYLSSLSIPFLFPFHFPLLAVLLIPFSVGFYKQKEYEFSLIYCLLFILSPHTPPGHPGWSLTLDPLDYKDYSYATSSLQIPLGPYCLFLF